MKTAKLETAAQQFGGIKKVVYNLTDYYLPRLDHQDLATKIVRIANEIPELEMDSYSTPSVESIPSQPEETIATAWWENQ